VYAALCVLVLGVLLASQVLPYLCVLTLVYEQLPYICVLILVYEQLPYVCVVTLVYEQVLPRAGLP
jgi:hypothetical protein